MIIIHQIFSPVMLGCFQDDEDEESEEESDDDDTAALLAELEKIKKERAEEQERKVNYLFTLMCLGKANVSLFCLVNLFPISILGAGAKGRGREDSHGEYLEWKSVD